MLLRPVVVRPSPSWCRLCTTWSLSSSAPSTPSKLGKYQVNSELGFTKQRNNKYILPSQFSMVFFFICEFNSPISLVKYFCFVVSLFCISGPRAEYELYLQYVYLWRENVVLLKIYNISFNIFEGRMGLCSEIFSAIYFCPFWTFSVTIGEGKPRTEISLT